MSDEAVKAEAEKEKKTADSSVAEEKVEKKKKADKAPAAEAEAESAAEPEKAAGAKTGSKKKQDGKGDEKAGADTGPEKKQDGRDGEKAERKDGKSRGEAASIMGANEAEADKAAETARKRGRGKSIPAGIAFVRSTFNNTAVSIADARGGVISWSSAGKAGFKGSRKSTAFAATMVAQDAARNAVSKGMHECEVRIQGAGAGRESAVRAIQQAGINVTMIKDCTPIPHNGCRPRKRRRV
ncbi:MAG: 30S ribosomal protein S11 [Kiritimatiellia bacterium]